MNVPRPFQLITRVSGGPTLLCGCEDCGLRRRAEVRHGLAAMFFAAICLGLGIMSGQVIAYLAQ